MFPDLARDDVFRLETRRLWLRWPRPQDVADIARHAGDEQVASMTSHIPHPYPAGAAAEFVLTTRQANGTGRQLVLALSPKDRPSEFIGCIGLRPLLPDSLDLGYWLAPPLWGRGLAAEAAQGLLDFAFTYSGVREIMASPRVINPASRRVLEKCGFAFVGSGLDTLPARGGRHSVDRYRLDRKAWLSLKHWRAPVPEVRRDERPKASYG